MFLAVEVFSGDVGAGMVVAEQIGGVEIVCLVAPFLQIISASFVTLLCYQLLGGIGEDVLVVAVTGRSQGFSAYWKKRSKSEVMGGADRKERIFRAVSWKRTGKGKLPCPARLLEHAGESGSVVAVSDGRGEHHARPSRRFLLFTVNPPVEYGQQEVGDFDAGDADARTRDDVAQPVAPVEYAHDTCRRGGRVACDAYPRRYAFVFAEQQMCAREGGCSVS